MGKDADQEHVSAYRAAIKAAAVAGPVAFQNWFCKTPSIKAARVRGLWDFALHILTPSVCTAISDPENKTALEIGYGGGRLLRAACGFFGKAIGVDIHQEPAAADFLQGHSNFELLHGDGRTLPIASSSIDFVYSFIVMMHLQSFGTFVSYLNETYRVLKAGGLAQIYFGHIGDGEYLEHKAPANHSSLLVNAAKAKSICLEIGFDVLDIGHSYKNAPNGYPDQRGQQDYLTLLKT